MGPLNTHNNFPPYFMFLTPVKESPRLLSKGQFKISAAAEYSNVFINRREGDWNVLIDMETFVLNTTIACGLTRYLTMTLYTSWSSFNDGHLDGFLNQYHDAFGLPDYNRDTRPNNTFAYFIQYRWKNWFKPIRGGMHLVDSTVSAKLPLMGRRKGAPLTLSMVYALKIPTGDPDYGLGSGEYDHGLFLLGQLKRSAWIYYFHLGYLFLSNPETVAAEIEINDIPSLFFGLEYLYNPNLSLLAQLNYFKSPIDAPHIKQFDFGGGEIELGMIYKIHQNVQMEFAFAEDIFGTGAPDFNFHFRTTVSFGP